MQPTAPRPLSPHLQVHRLILTMVVSMGHRLSGLWLSLCGLLFVAWMVAIAAGPAAYAGASRFFASVPVRIALAVALAALWYHMIAGIRHLAWDAGVGFERPVPRRTAVVVVVLSAVAFAATLIFSPAGRWLLGAP